MNNIWRNIIAVIVGLVIGHTLNYTLFTVGHSMFPIEGIDPNNFEDLKRVMPTLSFKYFIFPFLAHALGTLAAAWTASLIAKNNKMTFALSMGGVFLLGGIAAAYMIPAPTWFVVTDLLLAYIPMAWLGGKLSTLK